FVDVAPDELRSVRLNGMPLDVSRCFDRETRHLTLDAVQAENELVVAAVMAYSHDGEGLHRHVDPADGRAYLYAMSFLDAAPRWFACFDQPDLKAPLTAEARPPADRTALRNAPATAASPVI